MPNNQSTNKQTILLELFFVVNRKSEFKSRLESSQDLNLRYGHKILQLESSMKIIYFNF